MANVKHFLDLAAVGRAGPYLAHSLLVETVDRDAGGLFNPAFELSGALGIVQPREVFRGVKQPGLYDLVDLNRSGREYSVAADAAVIDMLVDDPEVLLAGNNGESLKAFADSALGLDVLPVVLDIERPAFGVMLGEVSRAAAIDLRRFAGDREIADQGFARFRLLLILGKADHLADHFQATRQPKLSCHDGGAAPLLGRHR